MTPLFAKLNLGANAVVHVLGAPDSFEPELAAPRGVTVRRDASAPVAFAIAFVRSLAEVESAVERLAAAAEGDATVWMAYPKASSKRYRCEFNRDTGWAALGRAGFEPVRQVAIDEDWSALRFRRVEFIASMKRYPDRALTAAGRAKAAAQRGR
jgi:hypothetical protein